MRVRVRVIDSRIRWFCRGCSFGEGAGDVMCCERY